MALLKSVINYKEKLYLFEKWLNEGYIVSVEDALYLKMTMIKTLIVHLMIMKTSLKIR